MIDGSEVTTDPLALPVHGPQGQDPKPTAPTQAPQNPVGPTPTASDNPFDAIFAGGDAPDQPMWDEMFSSQGLEESQRARGVGQNLKYMAAGIVKSAADGAAHLGSLAFRLSGALGPLGIGRGSGDMKQGWDMHAQLLKQVTGSEDPGVLDIVGAMAGYPKTVNVYDPASKTTKPMTLSDAADDLLHRKLGDAAVFADVAGAVLSFGWGPGAALGNAGAKLAYPLGKVLERAAGKTLAMKMARAGGIEAEAVKGLVKDGKVLDLLSSLPEWQKTASAYDKMLAAGGRSISDVLGMAGGNVAQSYGLSPDDQRFDAARLAVITAPFAVPLVRLGEKLAGQAITSFMGPEQRRLIGQTYQGVLDGTVSPLAAAKELNKLAGPVRRFGSDAVAGMFEGTAFMGLDPQAWELAGAWYGGDSKAGSQLMAMMFGSMAGVTGLKFALPHNQTHLFRSIRPDLNRLNTKISAESAKEALEASLAEPQSDIPPDVPPPDASLQEPKKAGELVTDPQKEQDLEKSFADEQRRAKRAAGEAKAFQTLLENRKKARESVEMEAREAAKQAKFGWADQPSLGVMRALHQDPTLHEDGTVEFLFDNDHSLFLRRQDDGFSVDFDPKLLQVLKDAGREVGDYETIAPTKVSVRGDQAKKLLDDVTLLSMREQMQGDLDFSRLGLQQVEGRPDLWMSPGGGGVYYKTFLDGSRVAKDKLGDTTERANFVVTDGFDNPKYPSTPAADALTVAITAKGSLAPDSVIDGIVGRAITLSQHSDSLGAQHLRDFFAQSDPQQLVSMLRPEHDQILAFQLGSLAAGNSNAQHAVGEVKRMLGNEVAGKERDLATEMAEAEAPLAPEDYLARLSGEPTASEREFMKSPEGRKRAMESAEHTVVKPEASEPDGAPDPEVGFTKQSGFGEKVPVGGRPMPRSLPDLIEPTGRQAFIEEGFGEGVPTGEPIHRPSQMSDEQTAMLDQAYGGFVPPIKDIKKLLSAAGEGLKTAESKARYFTERMQELLRGKGDDAFVDRIRLTKPQGERNMGEVQVLSKPAEKALRQMKTRDEIVETEAGAMSRAQAAMEQRKVDVPFTADEIKAGKLAADVFRRAAEMEVKAGGIRYRYNEEAGREVPEPMRVPTKIRTPRLRVKGWDEMLKDSASYERFLEAMVEKNKATIKDPETGERRPMTTQEMDVSLHGEGGAAKVSSAGRESAFEHFREYKWMPSVWEGKPILETNMFELLRQVPQQQARRAASIEEFGPDFGSKEDRESSKKDREYFKEKYDVEYGPDKPGVQERLSQFVAKTRGKEGKEAANLARDLVTDLEGGVPENWRMGDLQRFAYGLDIPARSALTAASMIHDPADFAWNYMMFAGNSKTAAKAVLGIIMHPIKSAKALHEAKILAESMGLIVRGMGQRDVAEAKTWWQKAIDAIQLPTTITEHFKIAADTMAVDAMLKRWSDKKPLKNDEWVVGDMLKFSPEQKKLLLSGEADAKLQAAFQREMVQLLVSRRPMGEGSQFSASPAMRAFVRFTNFMSGQLWKVARVYKTSGVDLAQGLKDKDYGKAGMAVYRSAKATGLITSAGLTSKLLSYMIAGLFRDENGAQRWWNELAYATTHGWAGGAQYFGGVLATQALGGPFGQLLQAFASPLEPRAWANITGPGALAYAIAKNKEGVDPTSPIELAKMVGSITMDAGYVPLAPYARSLAGLLGGTMAGKDPRSLEASRMTSAWKRLEGINEPHFEKTKPQEFYDAMSRIRTAIETNPGDIGAALRVAETDMQTVLGIANKQSVAATVRAFQFADTVPKDKIDKYAEFMGDERMDYVYAHDQAIRDFAKVIGMMHGESLTPFDQELEIAEGQARLGGGQMWGGLADRVVEDASVRMDAGQDTGDDLQQLAESMAAFPDQQAWMSERQLKSVMRPGKSYASRSRLIYNIMRQRVLSTRRGRKDSNRKMRKQGIDLSPFQQPIAD